MTKRLRVALHLERRIANSSNFEIELVFPALRAILWGKGYNANLNLSPHTFIPELLRGMDSPAQNAADTYHIYYGNRVSRGFSNAQPSGGYISSMYSGSSQAGTISQHSQGPQQHAQNIYQKAPAHPHYAVPANILPDQPVGSGKESPNYPPVSLIQKLSAWRRRFRPGELDLVALAVAGFGLIALAVLIKALK